MIEVVRYRPVIVRGSAAMRSVIAFAVVALAAAMFVPRYATQISNARLLSRAPAAQPAELPPPATANADSVIVPPDAFGRFRVDGRIDGRSLGFMIDTGASVVALTADGAASLGIHPAASEYTVLLKTANGTVRGAPARLGMVEVGNLVVRDVRAVVLPDGALGDNLLGLSFLTRLRHFEYSQGKMVLEQ
jgi:aspartyl protease family protein